MRDAVPLIVADMRETRSGVLQALQSRGKARVEISDLEVGDYIVSAQVGVERKQVQDLARSIVNRRLHMQIELLSVAFQKPVLIVEGTLSALQSMCDPSLVYGALAWVTLDKGTYISWSSGANDTALILESLARHAQQEPKDIPLRSGKPKDLGLLARYVIEGLPGCGSATATRLLAHFGSIENVITASENDLKLVAGVGERTAKEIRKLVSHGGNNENR